MSTAGAIPFALVVGCTVAACGADGPEAPAALMAVDDAGDTIRLQTPARRIVSLIPTTTEILLRAGLGNRVVGRTRWCDWPPGVKSIPSVGTGFPPSIEAVAARSPDLVLLYSAAVNRPAAAQLEALGIPVAELRTDRLSDVARAAGVIGALTGASAATSGVARAYERALAEASSGFTAERSDRPPVLLLAWPDPTVVLGAGSFMSELLALAGGRNVFDDVREASAPVSLETIVFRNPEMVFLADPAGAGMLARPEWQVVPAVRAGRIRTPLAPALARAGLRAPIAVRQLRAALNLSPSKVRP